MLSQRASPSTVIDGLHDMIRPDAAGRWCWRGSIRGQLYRTPTYNQLAETSSKRTDPDDGAGIVELYGVILPICVIDELDNTKYTGSDWTSRPRRPGNQSVASVQRRPVPGQRCYLAGWHDARDLRDRQTSDS